MAAPQSLTPQQQAQLMQQQMQMQAQQQQQTLSPDPRMQALIEADFRPVDLVFGEPNNCTAHCGPHKLEKCADCGVDLVGINRISQILAANPNLACPPPPQVINQKLSQVVNQTKEEGNTYFRTKQHAQALMKYSQALKFAYQRPPWEPQQIMREELATVLSNRSAAFFEAGDYIGALCDADVVIQLKKPWSKGHFRRAKALVGLGAYQEAKEAIEQGLQFEPQNADLLGTYNDIDRAMKTAAASKRRSTEKTGL